MLLAPNGQPSNLTPEQYKLVRTKAFKDWFGDWEKLAEAKIKDSGLDDSTFELLGRDVSKVVDKNGEPLVVYHGTKHEFNTYKSESLIWATNDLDYITERQSEENSWLGKRLISLFGNAHNVLDLTELGYDGIYGHKFNEILKKKGIDANYTSSDFKRPYAYLNNYSKAKFLLEYGINGIHIYITKNEKGFAFFKSNQIKLADGSNTTFDPNNPDIRFEDGGLTHSLNQSMNNITKNGIVITDEKSGIMAILYNTVNQSRKLGLYNTSLLYKTISEIDKDAASRIVVNINQGVFDEFDKDNIGKYKNSKTLLILNQNEVLYNSNNPDMRYAKGGKTKKSGGGDCYYVAGNMAMDFFNRTKYEGTPYLVHAEVQGQGNLADIRYGHAWVEDDVNVYDNSNLRHLVIPKKLYYKIGDIKTDNPKKYRKYTFAEAKKKMRETGNYGCWDIETDYEDGGEMESVYEKLGFTEKEIKDWKEEHKVNQRQIRNPKVMQSAILLSQGKITQEEYLEVVRENQPIKPFKEVPKIPTLLEIVGALKSNLIKTGIIGYTKFIEDGEYVASRLDINAYTDFDIWVVSVHEGLKEGNSIGYGQTAYLKNVNFVTSPKVALNIAVHRSNKTTIGRMKGNWVNKDPKEVRDMAVKYMSDKNWVQVGMNPFRHSWFYDKRDGMPLLNAEEIIQVGALVLAKNPLKTTPDNPLFIVDKNNPDIKFEQGGEITSKQDDYIVYLKYIENGKEIGHLNYYISLEDVMSNYIDKKPYNFKNEVYIEIVEVDKENRHKGIAKKLLNRAISDAKDLNVDVITLRRDSSMGCNTDDPYDTYLKNIYSSFGFIDTWNEKDVNESDGEKSPCAMHLDLKNIDTEFKKGGEVKINEIVLYYEKNGNFLIPKGTFYAWLYDDPTAVQKMNSGEWDFVMFPMTSMSIALQRGYIPPLLRIWDKKFQKDKKGIEHLLGIVQGYYDDKEGKLHIEMMTTNPKHRREGINANIIRQLREEFKVSQDDVVFEKPTKMGEKFIASKEYEDGGSLDSNTQLAKELAEEELYKIECLECDGSTRVLHYVFTKNGVKHKVMQGSVKIGKNKIIPLHFWLELPDGNIVDYKSRMWLGNDVDEGIFKPKKGTYIGKEIDLPMNETLYQILSMQDGGVFKSHKSIEQIAKEKNVKIGSLL